MIGKRKRKKGETEKRTGKREDVIICITGTPGTGKTKLTKQLVKELKKHLRKLTFKPQYKVISIDLNKELKKSKLNIGFDKERDSVIIREEGITEEFLRIINKKSEDNKGRNKEKVGNKGKIRKTKRGIKRIIIVDSHLSHFISPKIVDLCVICKCELKELKRRLKKRGYSEDKIRENLQAEIFDVCKEEASQLKHRFIEVDCSEKGKIKENISKISEEIGDFLEIDI